MRLSADMTCRSEGRFGTPAATFESNGPIFKIQVAAFGSPAGTLSSGQISLNSVQTMTSQVGSKQDISPFTGLQINVLHCLIKYELLIKIVRKSQVKPNEDIDVRLGHKSGHDEAEVTTSTKLH